MSELKTRFDQAVTDAQLIPSKPDNATLLQIYAIYKQATLGDVKGERPASFDLVGAAKFDAWEELQGTSKDDAKTAYIALIGKLRG